MQDMQARQRVPDAPWVKSYPSGVDWSADFPAMPLWDLFDQAVQRYADGPCLDFLGRVWSYQQIGRLVDRAAAGLQALGVGPGTKVGLFLPNCPYFVICFFAVLTAGGTVVSYNPLYAEREIAHQIEDSDTDLMVTLDLALLLPKLEPMLARTRLKAIIVGKMADILPFPKKLLFPLIKARELANVPEDGRHVWFGDLIANGGGVAAAPDPCRDIAALQYTGGTTGVPKGAALTHRNLTGQRAADGRLVPGDRARRGADRGAAAPVSRVRHDLRDEFRALRRRPDHPAASLRSGSALDRDRPQAPDHPAGRADALSRDQPSPRHRALRSVLAAPVRLGGAPLPLEVKQRFEQLSGCTLVEGYGLTECPVVCCNPIGGAAKQGSIGLPLPGTSIEVVALDDRRTALGPGQSGEICVRGPQVMAGYWNRPDETAAVLEGGRLHTGDIGYVDEDGACFVVDRLKELIICSGFNVYPRVVEEAIYAHPDVVEVAVCGMPDGYRGETVKAFVVVRQHARLDEAALLAFLEDRLSPIEMPKLVEFRDQLPKSAVGKILKRELLNTRPAADAAPQPGASAS
jgi:long-chain acyl-CoA synthetase